MHVIPATSSSRTPFREGISILYYKEMPRQAGHDSAQGMRKQRHLQARFNQQLATNN